MKIRRRKMEAGIPYLPMADIAFNLVLFFIMMAKTQDDSKLGVTFASVPETVSVAESRVRVAVDNRGKIYINGDEVGVRQLADVIGKILENEPAGKRTVLLKIHRDTLAATFEPIIEAVSEAGGEVFHVLQEDSE